MPNKVPPPLAPRFSAVLARFEEVLVVLFLPGCWGWELHKLSFATSSARGLGSPTRLFGMGFYGLGFRGKLGYIHKATHYGRCLLERRARALSARLL